MNIDKVKLRAARRALGAATDTEAVERALDVVLANSEINAAMDSIAGRIPDFRVE